MLENTTCPAWELAGVLTWETCAKVGSAGLRFVLPSAGWISAPSSLSGVKPKPTPGARSKLSTAEIRCWWQKSLRRFINRELFARASQPVAMGTT